MLALVTVSLAARYRSLLGFAVYTAWAAVA
jgi:hypothetical protein